KLQALEMYHNFYLGQGYFHTENYPLAFTYLDRAINSGIKEKDAYMNRGFCHVKSKDYGQAVNDFSAALQLGGQATAEVYTARAEARIYLNEFDAALEDLNAAIKLDDTNINNYYNRAILLEDLEKYDLAVKDYSKVIETNKEDALAYFNRGNCLMQSNQ